MRNVEQIAIADVVDGVGRHDSITIGSTSTKQEVTTAPNSSFEWTFAKVVWSVAVFLMAGVAEITGGWMVWAAIRGNHEGTKRKWWFGLIGSLVLVLYGFIPCAQPTDSFGRIYAVYGGFFIVMSFLFGWAVDGDRPDYGDIVGGMIALVGVLVVMLWPRS